VVKTIAQRDDTTEWTNDVADRVQETLANEGLTVFLQFLNSQGEPCMSIRDGWWFLATEDEIRQKTKAQFLHARILHTQRHSVDG
jgi:hypothetical protein